MKPVQKVLTTVVAITLGTIVITTFANSIAHAAPKSPERKSARIEHGRYLVHQVGMCIDCHSPRDEKGAFVESKHLTGSPLGFAPSVPMPWTAVAPGIAGLPAGFSDDDTVRFLMTGERPNGRPPALPPMPAYRFSREDAESIVAYLRTLGSETR